MTRSSVSGWQRRQVSTISATKSGRSPSTSAHSCSMAGLAHASIKAPRVSSKINADALFSPGNVASFRMQVSRMTLKIGLGATQCPRAPLGFDERDRLVFSDGLASVFAMRARKRGRELEPDDFPFHYRCRIHGVKLSEKE